ncbi:hypothetical protein DFJ73DRAFT_552432 [Zopfochytrium polystomum]|nr:hypothetical protein DFJ73DRAFT_552432 [Zopfochytrium polystomum]
MTHQTGFKPSQELADLFRTGGDSLRAIKVTIGDEELAAAASATAVGSWEQDYQSIQDWFDERNPCYVIFRLDSRLPTGDYGFLLILYVPDVAKVREKMLYAATRVTLTKELGDSKFVDVFHASSKDEVKLDGYRKHITHKDADGPLTEREMEHQRVRLTETGADIGTTTRKMFAASTIGLPVSEAAENALAALKENRANTVVVFVDPAKEQIDLHQPESTAAADELGQLIPSGEPFFVLYNFEYAPGESLVVFFYICPSASKVKTRMMFSSSKAAFIQYLEGTIGLAIAKKIELDSAGEISESYLKDYLQIGGGAAAAGGSPAAATAARFSKPMKAGRGAQRLTK